MIRSTDRAACVEKRVQARRQLVQDYLKSGSWERDAPAVARRILCRDLRHELNNPLTDSRKRELLLPRCAGKNLGPIPIPLSRRLETIAALAVRMRETVRRLSLACEALRT